MVRKQGRPDLQAMLKGIEPDNKEMQEETPDKPEKEAPAEPDLNEKLKRCYVVTGFHLEKIMLLKTKKYRKYDMSEIVCMAIDSFFEKEMNGEK